MSSFLLEMAWKSSCICGTTFILVELLRKCGPSDRARILHLAVALLLLLPAVSLLGPHVPIVVTVISTGTLFDGALGAPFGQDAPGSWTGQPALAVYVCGAAFVLCRFVVGVVMLGRWTSRAHVVSSTHWTEALSRVGRSAPTAAGVRLLESDSVTSPISWGWLRPIILIDNDTLNRTDEAMGVLAHEVAHIVRRDWAMLAMSHIAVALFWFNPLVWILKRAAVQAAEEAADAAAVETTVPTHYAQILLNSVGRRSGIATLAAHGMSCEPRDLARRVRRVLNAPRFIAGSAWPLVGMAASAFFAASLAAAEFVAPNQVAPLPGIDFDAAVREQAGADSIGQAQTEADRLRAEANAAQAKALAGGDVGDIGRANGMRGRADAAQGWVHALEGGLARSEAERRPR
jgi:bla regulator protein BlaR1